MVLCGDIMRLLMGLNKLGFANAYLVQKKKMCTSSLLLHLSLEVLSLLVPPTILLLLNEDAHEVEVVDNEGVERQLYHYIKGKS